MTDDEKDAEIARLRGRVDELLEKCSDVENQKRGWKIRAETLGMILGVAMVELPVGIQEFLLEARGTLGDDAGQALERTLARAMDAIGRVARRADMLEADAWTRCAILARKFVEDAGDPMGDYAPDVVVPRDGDPRGLFVRAWRKRFAEALDIAVDE